MHHLCGLPCFTSFMKCWRNNTWRSTERVAISVVILRYSVILLDLLPLTQMKQKPEMESPTDLL